MFYNQFIKICKARNIKPSPVLKDIGLSSGNLKRWENGASVTYETLNKLSIYFDIPVNYFFSDETVVDSTNNDISNETYKDAAANDFSFKKMYNILKSHPDYIISLMSESTISAHDLIRISKYLNCSPSYLFKGKIDETNCSDLKDITPPKELVLNILSKLAASDEYRYLQVRISTIIIGNLEKKNITMDNLIKMGLVEKKIRNLYDLTMPAEKKIGLNYSDLMNISEKFSISYECMFTGIGD